jgi:hypothetical protein
MEHTSVCFYGNDLGNLRDAMGGCVLSVKKIDDRLYGTRRHCLQPKEGAADMLRVAFIDFYRGLGMLKSFRFHTFSTSEAQSA